MPREGSVNLDLMVTKELGVMISMLKDAGFVPVVATASGQPFVGQTMTVSSDLKLADVRVADYAGFLVPCMAAGYNVDPAAVRIVRDAAAAGKPIAAQRGSLYILSYAGVLKGRKYAFLNAEFTEGTLAGNGVVQDGNIITSAVCPNQTATLGISDGTVELTRRFIQAMGGGAR